jgi:hypothetical protein
MASGSSGFIVLRWEAKEFLMNEAAERRVGSDYMRSSGV